MLHAVERRAREDARGKVIAARTTMPDSNSIPPRRRAVITGIGPIAACGVGLDAFWSSIREGRSGIAPVTMFDASIFHARNAGEVRDWDAAQFFPLDHGSF